jgi:asparagine synthetase B (glutamine-hydrolysing)
MSAIAGIFNRSESRSAWEQGATLFEGMSNCMADEDGWWRKEGLCMVSRTRWIAPESVGAPNPLRDEERDLAIVADAIIDNRAELFRRLAVPLDQARSVSDQELILLAYDKWGTDAAAQLLGDFSFVIWDGRLYCARDFSGGRMLYYQWDGVSFRFCSLLKPLLTLPGISRVLNEQWLAQYIAITAVVDVVDMGQTVYKDVMQVPPAHYLLLEQGKLSITRYNRFDEIEPLKLRRASDYVEAFDEVFQNAVDARIRTFRMVGAQLSGGLDSGAVAGFAARRLKQENRPLYTYSYVPVKSFKDFTPGCYAADETAYIARTVRHVGGIREHFLDFEGIDPYTEMDDMLDVMEMPYKFYINSFWLKGIFNQAGEQDVGVLLNGGRGNLTISWGDAIAYYGVLFKQLRWFKLMSELKQHSVALGTGRKYMLSLVGKEMLAELPWREAQAPPFQRLINRDFAERTGVYEQLNRHGIGENGWLARGSVYQHRRNHFHELFHWNASNTLAAKLSYRYGVWKRDPTNDLRVISFCLSLPEDQYVRQGMSRALVRRATERMLPDEIRLNERVRGVQGADWLHRVLPKWDQLHGEFTAMAKNERLLELVDRDVLAAALQALTGKAGPEDAHARHINALMLCLILHRFLEQTA